MHLCEHCYSGKAICITYSECVFVDLSIQNALRMCILSCGLNCYNIFPHYLIHSTIFEKKLLNIKCVCFEFLHIICLKHFSF